MKPRAVHSIRALGAVTHKDTSGVRTLCISVLAGLLLSTCLATPASADCPAAPLASADDMVASFIASQGGTQAAPSTLFASTVKEGMLVYDDTNNALKLCDGTNWVSLIDSGSAGTFSQWQDGAGGIIYYNGGNVGIGTAAPDASALLDVASTSKGFLPPRMTEGQRDAIASPATGLMIFNETASQHEFWNGTTWTSLGGGVPSGIIAAFAATACPSGWTEYAPARGRFLRGIDNGAGNDPDGTRAPSNVQADAFQGHYHDISVTGSNWNWHQDTSTSPDEDVEATGNVDDRNRDLSELAAQLSATDIKADGINGVPRVADETRPKNVAVMFCQYAGGAPLVATPTPIRRTPSTTGRCSFAADTPTYGRAGTDSRRLPCPITVPRRKSGRLMARWRN